MKQLAVYFNFSGKTEEALHFYESCFNGAIENLQRFENSPLDIPEGYEKKVMHAEFKAGELFFMASDGMPDQTCHSGNNITLSLSFNEESELMDVFNALSEHGKVILKPQETFWGALFGKVVDQYGIEWMLSCTKQPD